MSGWSERRSYALAARMMTSSRKTGVEDVDTAGGYSMHFGRSFTIKPAHNKWLRPTAIVANAPFASGDAKSFRMNGVAA